MFGEWGAAKRIEVRQASPSEDPESISQLVSFILATLEEQQSRNETISKLAKWLPGR